MRTYLFKRILQFIPVMIGVTFLVYLMMHLMPVDPARAMLTQQQAGTTPNPESSISEEELQRVRERLGLDKPFIVQYLTWLGKVVRGDLGTSFRTGRNVSLLISKNFGATAELGFSSLFIATFVGVPLGIIAAVKHNTWWDTGTTMLAVMGVSMPSFWQGLLFIWFFGLTLNWFPTMGYGGLSYLVMPALTLGTHGMATMARLTRSSMVEVLRQDYVTTARAKGLGERVVVYKHALRNALIPVITIIGLSLGSMLAGTVIVENVFGRPGLGRIGVNAIYEKDFPVIQATVLILSVTFVLGNMIADMAYAYVDPRIRYE